MSSKFVGSDLCDSARPVKPLSAQDCRNQPPVGAMTSSMRTARFTAALDMSMRSAFDWAESRSRAADPYRRPSLRAHGAVFDRSIPRPLRRAVWHVPQLPTPARRPGRRRWAGDRRRKGRQHEIGFAQSKSDRTDMSKAAVNRDVRIGEAIAPTGGRLRQSYADSGLTGRAEAHKSPPANLALT